MEHKLRRDDLLIRVAMLIVKTGLKFYYDIHIENGKNIPKEGPALILPKHRSRVDLPLEAITIYETTGRHANYIMKSFLLDRFYEKLGGISLLRPKDLDKLPRDRRKEYFKKAREINDKAQDYMKWLYSNNELIVVHPEGERRKNDLKFENGVYIMNENSFYRKFIQYPISEQIPIIPVGIEYEELRRFRSKVYIRVGAPIKFDYHDFHENVEAISNQIKCLSGIQ